MPSQLSLIPDTLREDASARDAPPRFSGYLPPLDSLRGLAILGVLLAHLWRPEMTTFWGRLLTKIAALGWVGVDLFFVLSGMLITGVLLDSRGRWQSLGRFLARRALRIFPLYYFFLFISLVLMPIYVDRLGLGRFFGFDFDGDAALWPWFAFHGFNIWAATTNTLGHALPNSVVWSLAIEEQFYLVWPWLILFIARRFHMRLFLACLLISIAARATIVMTLPDHWIAVSVLTPCRLDCFAVGAIIANYVRSKHFDQTRWRNGLRLGAVCLGAALLWIILLPESRLDRTFQMFGFTLLAIGFGSVVGAMLDQRLALSRFLGRSTLLQSLGRYSYGIYLYHLLVQCIARPPLERFIYSKLKVPLLDRVFWLFFGIIVTWLVAKASYHMFEVHFLRLKARLRDTGAS